jgi:hypothetical protein
MLCLLESTDRIPLNPLTTEHILRLHSRYQCIAEPQLENASQEAFAKLRMRSSEHTANVPLHHRFCAAGTPPRPPWSSNGTPYSLRPLNYAPLSLYRNGSKAGSIPSSGNPVYENQRIGSRHRVHVSSRLTDVRRHIQQREAVRPNA